MGHLGDFQFEDVLNDIAMNILEYVCCAHI